MANQEIVAQIKKKMAEATKIMNEAAVLADGLPEFKDAYADFLVEINADMDSQDAIGDLLGWEWMSSRDSCY